MRQKVLKYELQNIISGKSQVRFGRNIQAITSYIEESTLSSKEIRGSKQFKEQEAEKLREYSDLLNLWVNVDLSQYVSEGAEQKVYLKDSGSVLKINDSIYYSTWKDYFINLLLHNHFFADTAYRLVGFTKENNVLYAVVEQAFVSTSESTNIQTVKDFMGANGFQILRNNDYIHTTLGIIIEDLHDENVLTKNGLLYFIDTVFYLTEDFYQ
jgi:hypothetical protein